MKLVQKQKKLILSGGYAAGEAIRQINPEVMAVYPITPQTPIVEYFAKKVADGEANTEIIPVESEHSAMSACIGASAAGVRAVTASSSQGIMYMMEVLPVASGMRLPIVMAVANRAISAPINIHGDHSDAMMMRDTGWIQLFCENPQEVYDSMILAFKLAEKILLPVAVNFDGFFTSHSFENVSILEDGLVRKFLGKLKLPYSLFDFERPITFGSVALQDSYFEFRRQIYEAMIKAAKDFEEIREDFKKISLRDYSKIEGYRIEKAEVVLVGMGSVAGTAKEVVDKLREKGKKVGFLKIRLFRPFPSDKVKKILNKVKRVVVLDRNLAFGTNQVLAQEIMSALGRPVESVVFGLGGRDIFEKQLEKIFLKEGKKDAIKFIV